jgi:hypothetical protein
MTSVLVIGATGYSGAYVAAAFAEDDDPKPPPIVGWRAEVERAVLAGGGVVVRPGLTVS